MRFPPSSTTLFALHRPGRACRPGRSPTRWPRRPRRPSSTSRATQHYARTHRRPARGLPARSSTPGTGCLEEGADFSAMHAAIRERDVPTIRRDLGPAGRAAGRPVLLRLPGRDSAGLQVLPAPRDLRPGRLRHRRLGHRLPQLDPGDPARRLHRRRRRTTGASSAAAQQLPLRLWEHAPDEDRRTGRAGTSLASLHGGGPRPAVTRHAPHGARGITVTRRRRRDPDVPRPRSSPRSAGCCCRRSTATSRSSRSTTGRRSSAPTTWVASKLFVPVDRPFWLDTDRGDRPAT